MSDTDSSILVVTDLSEPSSGRVERGVADSLLAKGLSELSVSLLRQNMHRLLSQLRTILDEGQEAESTLVVDQITVAAHITADGQVAILGSGAGLQAESAITFTLRRRE